MISLNHKEIDPFLAAEISRALESMCESEIRMILDQLGDLVRNGLLLVERSGPRILGQDDSGKIILQGTIKLHLKDQEYIRRLEQENNDLREKIESIEKIFIKAAGNINIPLGNT